jgi:hypothetical protein
MSSEETESRKLQFFYQTAPFHRTTFISGAWAGITPSGLIQLGLFNDLRPMPEMVIQEVVGDTLGAEIEKLEKRGVIREIEATVIMPLATAKLILPLIQQMIDQLDTIQKAQAEKSASSDHAS